MKIYEFSLFNNENLIADIKGYENSKWVDETHLIEFNRNFNNKIKPFNYVSNQSNIIYHPINAENLFTNKSFFESVKRKIRYHAGLKDNVEFSNHYISGHTWHNEAIQRNYASLIINSLKIKDDDILIFSDIDEIIDSNMSEYIINLVKKYEIITIRNIFTMIYFNLGVNNWGGPSDYSYRIFCMTGKKYKELNITIDMLRKAGERGKLKGIVHESEKICGRHYSWIGNANFISNKIKSYSHVEHRYLDNIEYINNCLKYGKSIIPGVQVQLLSESTLLSAITKDINKYSRYLFGKI